MGAEAVSVPVYRNLVPGCSKEAIDAAFKNNPDLVTFTSSSTVSNLVEILRKHNKERYLSRIKGASIGPVTTKTAEKAGIPIAVDTAEHTIPGLVNSILEYFIK
jgi:uroporphyrinogen III methyltransferase/synthase